jgi:hypothetical protein
MSRFQCADGKCKGTMVPYDGPNPAKFNSAVCSVHNSREYAEPETETKAEEKTAAPEPEQAAPVVDKGVAETSAKT